MELRDGFDDVSSFDLCEDAVCASLMIESRLSCCCSCWWCGSLNLSAGSQDREERENFHEKYLYVTSLIFVFLWIFLFLKLIMFYNVKGTFMVSPPLFSLFFVSCINHQSSVMADGPRSRPRKCHVSLLLSSLAMNSRRHSATAISESPAQRLPVARATSLSSHYFINTNLPVARPPRPIHCPDCLSWHSVKVLAFRSDAGDCKCVTKTLSHEWTSTRKNSYHVVCAILHVPPSIPQREEENSTIHMKRLDVASLNLQRFENSTMHESTWTLRELDLIRQAIRLSHFFHWSNPLKQSSRHAQTPTKTQEQHRHAF